ncbi:MAG: hypothetical protein KDA96_01590 [Planctomycetaceae bacterium]|nr:hypothetical protein [Planctomycetaceae bacterium]
MALKRHYTLSEVHDLICESEGRRPKAGEDGGHTVALHGDGRTGTAADGRMKQKIILAGTIEESRAMDPADGFALLSTDEKDVDARFTSRLALVKAVTAALNGPEGQLALGKIEGNGKPRATFIAPLSPGIGGVESYVRKDGALQRGLTANSLFVKINRIGNGRTARLHLQTAYPKDVS